MRNRMNSYQAEENLPLLTRLMKQKRKNGVSRGDDQSLAWFAAFDQETALPAWNPEFL